MNTIPYDELQQENIKLRQQVAYLQQQLSPPAPPARELKYWIVTWLQDGTKPMALSWNTWGSVLREKYTLENNGHTHIRILEQIVFV